MSWIDGFLYFCLGVFFLKIIRAFTDLRIVTGRTLEEFSFFDRRTLRRCLHMSSMAYKKPSEEEKKKEKGLKLEMFNN